MVLSWDLSGRLQETFVEINIMLIQRILPETIVHGHFTNFFNKKLS